MDINQMKDLLMDVVKDTSNQEKVVDNINNTIKYVEELDNQNKLLSDKVETYNTQLENARQTNIKLFEQVTIDKRVNEPNIDEVEEIKPPSQAEILEQLGD